MSRRSRLALPISLDDDAPAAARRRARADADVVLHRTGKPCPGCEQMSRLSGGTGCRCGADGDDLAGRCLQLADKVAGR